MLDISSIAQVAQASAVPSLLTQKSGGSADGTSMFQDIFDKVVNNANATDSALNADVVKAAEGELDNPEQLMIDSTKAGIALNLASSLRTAALDAYSDIIKMSV